VLLRPEQLRLSAGGGQAAQARVRSIDFYGHDSRIWLDLAAGGTVSARLEGLDLPTAGDDVTITVVGPALPFPATGPLSRSAPVASLAAGALLDDGDDDGDERDGRDDRLSAAGPAPALS
jgi:iron(III) transport system ATP-binding protein